MAKRYWKTRLASSMAKMAKVQVRPRRIITLNAPRSWDIVVTCLVLSSLRFDISRSCFMTSTKATKLTIKMSTTGVTAAPKNAYVVIQHLAWTKGYRIIVNFLAPANICFGWLESRENLALTSLISHHQQAICSSIV